MKKSILFIITIILTVCSYSVNAQRSIKIAYIDSEYILEKIPEYQEAISQLNKKANDWKKQIELRLAEIDQKRKHLSSEKVLLTQELIKEREEDILFEENEVLSYQQKRFGPEGDLYVQQKQLMQPIQDQIFAAVQEIASSKQYNFIFDKASDATMLYTDKQYDLSELIIRSITRSAKRKQAKTRAEKREAKKESEGVDGNLELEARERELEQRKLEREKAIEKAREEKLKAREARIKAAEERRKKILEERQKAMEKREQENDFTKINNENTEDTKPESEIETEKKEP